MFGRLLDWLSKSRVERAVTERDYQWGLGVKQSFFTDGGHPFAGGTVSAWPQHILNAGFGVRVDTDWWIITYDAASDPTMGVSVAE